MYPRREDEPDRRSGESEKCARQEEAKGLSGVLNQSSTGFSDGCGDLRVRRDAADNFAPSLSSPRATRRKNPLADEPSFAVSAHLLAQLVEFLELSNLDHENQAPLIVAASTQI
jgi:hypothetical protein